MPRSRVGWRLAVQSVGLFAHLSSLDNVTLAQRRVLGRGQIVAEVKAIHLLDRVGRRGEADEPSSARALRAAWLCGATRDEL